MKTLFTISAIVGSAMLAFPALSFAGPAENYVKNLTGSWRGGGTVTVNDRGKRVKLRCSTKNTLDKSSRTLSMRGRCASSQGTRPLRGSIRYSADGRKITSANFRIAGRGGSATARLKGNSLILSGAGKDDDGKRVRTISTIRGGGSRYSISLSSNSGKGYKSVGTLSFSR